MNNNTGKQKIGILGYGEVGRAIAKFYKNPKIKDLKRDDGLVGVDILNVCIPWSDDFFSIVKDEIKKNNPNVIFYSNLFEYEIDVSDFEFFELEKILEI